MEIRLQVRAPRFTDYDVTAEDFETLSAEMDDHGCWGHYGFPHTFRPIGNPVERINLTIRPQIEMPNWTRYRQADDAHKREWDRMIAALRRHELEHHRLLNDKAEQFRDSIPNITIPMDRTAANRLMADFLREAQAVMDSFDRRTRNGQTDGVELNDP
jgi:Bacterial protein of unknown function (DUF922)